MNNRSVKKFWPALLVVLLMAFAFRQQNKPVVYIIGDSTVRNSNNVQRGWGAYLGNHLDTTRISVSNQAMAGRSTRTFIKEGRWEKVLSTLKPGDFVLMQFGHNEGSAPDTTRNGYRGVLRGIGDETKELTWPDGKKEVVLTYGAYLRKFIKEAKAKGATPVVLSMIPRNQWADGKVKRANNDFGKWAKEAAEIEGVVFIDLNQLTADKYDAMGPDKVKEFFPGDHTHTNEAGALVNAASVAEGIKAQKKLSLAKFLR
ncbi:rhamnogalacturonan acetylesterase [Pedobacter sp. P351]|uniref:rhamnogalacturonan acetylesterase n=1 Tax=Pedobacter superstes TaxID=3133441 RepID=UPI003097E90F